MITGGKRWRRYEISAIAPAYPQPVSPASGYPDKARLPYFADGAEDCRADRQRHAGGQNAMPIEACRRGIVCEHQHHGSVRAEIESRMAGKRGPKTLHHPARRAEWVRRRAY
jgi:hypothetical protein